LRVPRKIHVSAFPAALFALGLTVMAAWAAGFQRVALWPVIRACVATYTLTGSPFPCLQVDLEGGEARGFVVLRPPVGESDTILSPTRRVTGVEDPFLQSPDAPNYFAAAWAARTILDSEGSPIDPTRVALVVNPASVRSQDQMHIHIGCLVPEARAALDAFAARAPVGEWSLVGPLVPHSMFWGLPTGRTELDGVHPFQLAADQFARQAPSRADLTIAVATARIDGRDEFVILATYAHAPHQWWAIGSDDLLDHECRE
jgi:CDP-diacylglycerol pyrophosphatase